MNWLELLIAFIAGGGINAVFNYYLSKKKDTRETFESILKVWSDDNKRLRDETQKLEEEIRKLHKMITDLQSKLIVLESSQSDLPIPVWLKDLNGVVIYVNDAYEQEFLTPRGLNKFDYIGHTDDIIWPANIAKAYAYNDQQVIKGKLPIYTQENVSLTDKQDLWYIIKYLRYASGSAIGVGGIAIPKNKFLNT